MTRSSVTSPADPTYRLYELTEKAATTLTVKARAMAWPTKPSTSSARAAR